MLSALLDAVAGWPAVPVLAVVAGVLVVESGTLAGLLLPGTTVTVALGLWTHAVPGALVPAIAVAAVATVTGAHLGLRRGRVRGVPAAVRRWPDGWAATAALLATGHWAAAARPVVPRMAGAAGVPYRLAGPVLVVSGAAWAATLVMLGRSIGPVVLTHAGWLPVAVVVVLVAGLAIRAGGAGRSPRYAVRR